MKVTGHERRTDWPKLGPSILIATALVVGIRTARWAAQDDSECSTASDVDPELDREVRFARRVTLRVLTDLLDKHEDLFPQKLVPTWEPTDEDVPK